MASVERIRKAPLSFTHNGIRKQAFNSVIGVNGILHTPSAELFCVWGRNRKNFCTLLQILPRENSFALRRLCRCNSWNRLRAGQNLKKLEKFQDCNQMEILKKLKNAIGYRLFHRDERVSSGNGFVAESFNGFCFTQTLAITADALDGEC